MKFTEKKDSLKKAITITFDKQLLLAIILGIVILVAGFAGGVLYQKHVDNEYTLTSTPIICDCPMMMPHVDGGIVRPCC